ncbi:MAG TPA: sugar phosphate nucleotidyltransferase [Spirochaetia bacterium]|nr:sugar phosphate nucleotidyltransferase [Spirochaetia bacterium]
MAEREFEVFVPGRVCLFGEHSDWAGGHRRINSSITPGYAIICGTNQGLRAHVRSHPDRLIFHSSLTSDGKRQEFDVPMQPDALLAEARKGGFFSYVAGVAYQILTHNTVKGLVIDNDVTDLPVKKGLSSSAAVCVLTARAFNLVYDLKMTVRGEMDYAYRGEITTPSRCGRMDQGCAYGSRPVMMEFDGDSLDVSELSCGADFHFIVADLKATKDTVKILADLNKAFPFAENDLERGVQEYLGHINKRILAEAADALERGDAERLGALMTEAQVNFDRYAAPACPEQLRSPLLHKALSLKSLAPYVHGGKGVGSQGDGSVQFLARDEQSREEAIRVLEKELGLSCLRLTVPRSKKIRKAVITAAGFGTRLFPMTAAVRKEFLPVVDQRGRMLPLILANVEEVVEAGIDEICIIIQEQDRSFFQDFFAQNIGTDLYDKLSARAKESLSSIREIGRKVVLQAQGEQKGLGHAVYQVREWVGNEPFLLVLGDHLFVKHGATGCARQLVERFEELETAVIGLQPTSESDVGRFGTVGGNWVDGDEKRDLVDIAMLKEKPAVEFAEEYLKVEGLPEKTYLTVFGLYLLTPQIFEELQRGMQECGEENREIELTSALDALRRRERILGLIIEGQKIDIGLPSGYIEGLLKYAGRA